MSIKSLVKDTAIYGVSSIVGRFLNWLLVPLYTYQLANTAEYGVVTNLYSWVALLMVLLTYGMETTFFRFANKEGEDSHTVFSTALLSITASTLLFCVGCCCFLSPIGQALQYGDHSLLLKMMLVVLAFDLIMTLPFCLLRYQNRPYRFAAFKLLFIFLNIGLNLFFLLWMPKLVAHDESLRSVLLSPGWEVRFIIVSNLIATSVQFLCMLPQLLKVPLKFDPKLWRQMMSYSFPLLILGLAGMLNQTADKILLPLLIDHPSEAMSQLGIYGANFKIAVVMVMFAQAFRFAYEPYFFAQSKQQGVDNRKTLAEAMKYFVVFGLFIYVGVIAYMDVLKHFIGPKYYEGLSVVPVVMITELMFGIFFNLSVWYKLTDQTRWGAYFSVAGAVVTVVLNVMFIPQYGYWACAWAGFVSYLLMTLASYVAGRKHYPIPYDLRRMGSYALLAALFTGLMFAARQWPLTWRLASGTLFVIVFALIVYRRELKGKVGARR